MSYENSRKYQASVIFSNIERLNKKNSYIEYRMKKRRISHILDSRREPLNIILMMKKDDEGNSEWEKSDLFDTI